MLRITAVLSTLALLLGTLPSAAVRATDPALDGPVVTSDGIVLPPLPPELQQPSVHAQMLLQHADDNISFEPGGAPSVQLDASGQPQMAGAAMETDGALSAELSAAGLPNGLRKEVFGFLPYWMLTDSALASMHYQLVSTIAYFSVNAQKDGDLAKGTSSDPTTGWAGWRSSAMTTVLNRAHREGVRVVLTVTMMAWDSGSAARQADLLHSSRARSRLVNQIVSAVRNRGADGVNLDFEPLATSLRDEYVSFVKQLKRGLVNAGAGSYLTVSVMASAATWATGYDVPGLTASGAADALFVMGYDFHWSGSSRAGGVAPIQSPYTIDVSGTMADFLTQTRGSKLIWGVPYYGRTWPTETSALNSRTLGGGSKAYYYSGARIQAQQYGRRWDDVGKVPWYRYWDGAARRWVQGYYDDVRSLGVKYNLINSRGLAGTGMWTLLMDQGRDELWRLLARKFVTDTAPPVGGIRLLPGSVDAEAIKVRWRAQDYASGVASYDVQWRRAGGTWHLWRQRTKSTYAWFTGTTGRSYEFRARARDRKGNLQSWASVPGTPSSLKPGTFAKVVASTLNVRSGPGTSYGIVDEASAGDVVYVLEGPVAAGGYSWYRVQYRFSEWPSADHPRIAWMAGAASGDPLLAPRSAPTRTRLAPFVSQESRTSRFSPNGDGVLDRASIGFELAQAASAVRLDVLNAAGNAVRSISLGPRPAGANVATWNGRFGSGARAPDGRYLVRITATDNGGDQHFGPAATFSSAAMRRWGIVVDTRRPVVDAVPDADAEMFPATQRLVVDFSEPVRGVRGATVGIFAGTSEVAAHVRLREDRERLVITPDVPLSVNRVLEVRLDDEVHDAAGNRPSPSSWTFTTAPGHPYSPWRPGRLGRGTRSGYVIAQDGALRDVDRVTLSQARDVRFGQRAELPNLPGNWLYAATGPLEGRWLRETARQHVDGFSGTTQFGNPQQIRLRAATHVGFRFAVDGSLLGTRTLRLTAASSAESPVRAVINGRTFWRLSSGRLQGYWIAESATAHRRGTIGRQVFATEPRIDLAPGTYTGHSYNSRGRVTGSLTDDVGRTTVPVSAWAVINGTPRFLVSSGTWAGLWLAETGGIQLHV